MPLLGPDGNPISSRPQPPGGDQINVPPQGMPGLHRPDGGKSWKTDDSYQNFMASVGIGTENLQSNSTYGFNPITRERTLLEWMYRSSWICGVAVDVVADDMTKMGVDWTGQMPPDDQEKMHRCFRDFNVWGQLNDLIKWGRLYGGAIAVIEIAGQDPKTPLRIETIPKGSYRGLTPMDRWMVEPSLSDLVAEDESRTERGLPRYYRVTADAPAYPAQTIHYSRCFRYEGFALPYWQKVAENLWSMSIYERLYDRLVAFDSATQGVAQLIYKAYLRWVKIKGLREMITVGGTEMQKILNQVNMIRFFQSNEGITMLDGDDEFGTTTYSFAGLDEALLTFGQQLSGALGIPLVRLFGQSPAGLNSTGESDLRTYYDAIHQQQELRLRRPVEITARVIAKSEGIELPDDALINFEPLWQLLPKEKAELAETVTRTVLSAEELGVIGKKRALEELRQSAQQTGIWSTLTDEEIKEAEQDDLMAQQMSEMMPMPGAPPAPGAETTTGHPGSPGQPQPGAPAPGGNVASFSAPKPHNPVPPPTISLGRGKG
jgi:phage-related protein (TIGR01555 family)